MRNPEETVGFLGGLNSEESACNAGDLHGWESWFQSLGLEDSLEKGMLTHSRILPWRIPWTEKPGGLQSTGSQRVRHDQVTNTFTFLLKNNGEASVTGERMRENGSR